MADVTTTGWQPALPYTLPLVISASLAVIVAMFVWQRRTVPGARPLIVLSIAAAVWSFAYAMEIAATPAPIALFWARVQYLGIMTLPVAWIAFTLEYAGLKPWLTRRTMAEILIVPALTQIAVWTNDDHGLIWPQIRLNTEGPFPILDFDHGPAFWVCNIYAHICLASGTLILLWRFVRSQQLYLSQIVVFLIGALAPWIGNGLYVLNLTPWTGLDLSPFGFTFTAGAIAFGAVRLRFLDVVPIARDIVLESMSQSVIVLDDDNRIVDINRAAQHVIGCTAAEVIGKPIRQALSRWPQVLDRYYNIVELNEEVQLEIEGRPLVLDVLISPLRDRNGRLRGRLIVWHDITRLKQIEEVLRQRNDELTALQQTLMVARDQAEAAHRAKSAFLAHMSHEVRTPLSAILGYTDLIRLDLTRRGQSVYQEELEAIHASAQHLLTMINNILDLSKIDAGRMPLYIELFSIEALVHNVTQTARPLAARNGNSLTVIRAPDADLMTSDKTKIRQVLLNLLSNAAKFTENGAISLRIWRELSLSPAMKAIDDGADWIVFEIADTGIGIAPEHLPLLFQDFSRIEDADHQRYGGTGLGLAISRQFCRLMGGDITVASAPGKGTTFTVRLPATIRSEGSDNDAVVSDPAQVER
ncbi:histidine kinase N-terminal 7TM domain-containing protein [Roseiflexus castenholzii]|uniref:Circadian input-output histidine kinase CikA n=1 Tax=Roseiflexus castenholzii (strain DSM 13941 / HLO8) TaxID=383372 RepID=A7NMF0_ROSCS|nr:histidine kinase N-terminal 7TM domain-containing protein [Roseiflexus castenholzii]ABU58712.1 multi-sensor signal transduction histidine kinase [Roseiflexus castenholzii DSM 13941]